MPHRHHINAVSPSSRTRLLVELDRLQAECRNHETLEAEVHPDHLDQSLSDQEREQTNRRIEECTFAIRAIEHALERLESGAYGVCEECGEPIAYRRLRALPWAVCCLECQQRIESANREAAPASHGRLVFAPVENTGDGPIDL